MAEIANVGFAADTSALDQAKASLQGMVAPAKAAESSASKLSATLSKLDSAADKLVAAASGLSSVSDRLAAALHKDASAAAAAASGMDRAGSSANAAAAGMVRAEAAAWGLNDAVVTLRVGTMSFTQAAAQASTAANGMGASFQQLDAHVEAYNARMANVSRGTEQLDSHVTAFRNNMRKAGKAVQLTAQDMLNLTRQGADVGVTLAMGMNPFMIAMQQGPQIFDALQVAAIRSGTGIKAVFVQVGRVIWTALAPILPIILGIAAVVGVIAAAWGLATRSINKGLGDNIDHLNLTEKQMKRLKDAGVETSVTMGDSLKALGTTIKEYFFEAFGTQIDWLSDKWNWLLDAMTTGMVAVLKYIVGALTGAFTLIASLWTNLPGMVSDAMTQAANAALRGFSWLVNKIIDGLNFVQEKTGTGIKLGSFEVGQINNENAGALAAGLKAAREAGQSGFDAGSAGVDAFGQRLAENASATRDARVRKAAGEDTGSARSKRAPKTDAEKFSDITKGVESEIAALRAQREAIGLSARASAELEQRTKMLNQAREKGITLTDAMRAEIDKLATAFGNETQALINAQFAYDLVKDTDKEVAALEAQRAAIGLVGRDLAYQTKLTELTSKAIADQVEITDELTRAMQEQAGRYADAYSKNDAAQFYNEQAMSLKEANEALAIERATIGMTDEAAKEYVFTQNLLNEARRRGIELSPEEIAALQASNREYVAMAKEIEAVREAVAFSKDVSRGFFDDMVSGLRDSKSAWETFGNAVANVLTKLASKLADSAFDALFSGAGKKGGFFDNLFGGGKGSSLFDVWMPGKKSKLPGFAKGSAFDGSGITRFAKGGAFTNSIVSKPTLFQFANGGALGEMGEAGPEAIMPLMRGPDGSLGVKAVGGNNSNSAASQPQRMEVVVKAYPTETLYTEIETIAQDTATSTVQQGIQQYDALMPSRVNEIAQDDRVR